MTDQPPVRTTTPRSVRPEGAPADTGIRQVRPKTEGWQQAKDETGRPLLQFASPKRGKPPVHLADLTHDERIAKLKEVGLPASARSSSRSTTSRTTRRMPPT